MPNLVCLCQKTKTIFPKTQIQGDNIILILMPKVNVIHIVCNTLHHGDIYSYDKYGLSMLKDKQEAHGPHRLAAKQVQFNKHICSHFINILIFFIKTSAIDFVFNSK